MVLPATGGLGADHPAVLLTWVVRLICGTGGVPAPQERDAHTVPPQPSSEPPVFLHFLDVFVSTEAQHSIQLCPSHHRVTGSPCILAWAHTMLKLGLTPRLGQDSFDCVGCRQLPLHTKALGTFQEGMGKQASHIQSKVEESQARGGEGVSPCLTALPVEVLEG